MSIETLQADLASNMEEVNNLSALSSVGDVVSHLKNTFWPFTANVVAELAEMDGALADMYEGQEDSLRFETGRQFAVVIAGAGTLIDELESRVSGDAKLLAAIKEWRQVAKDATETLEEITLPEGVGVDEEEDDDEGEEGDDDDDDDAPAAKGAAND